MSASVENTLRKAGKAFAGRRFSEALSGFQSVLEKFPANQRARRGAIQSRSALADEMFASNHPPRDQLDAIAGMINGGEAGQAVSACRAFLTKFPKGHGLYNLLGAACSSSADEEAARNAFEQAVLLKPDFMGARANLGRTLMRLGEREKVEALTAESLTIAPEDPQTHNLIAAYLIELRQFESAFQHAQKAVHIKPDFAEAHNHLGLCLRHAGKFDQAIDSYRRAIELNPRFAEAINNLGLSLMALGDNAPAAEAFHSCLAIDPRMAMAHNNLGQLALQEHRPSDALDHYAKAKATDQNFIDADFNSFVALCHAGKMDLAFTQAECRFDPRRKVPVARSYSGNLPAWDGAPLSGKTILIHAEQGLGDTLMFLRFLNRMADMGGTVMIAAQRPLVAMTKAGWPDLDVISTADLARDHSIIEADYQIPLMSLPLYLGAGRQSLSVSAAYLSVPASIRQVWSERLGHADSLRVGFTFKGSADHLNDSRRSIPHDVFINALPQGPEYHFLGIDLLEKERQSFASRKDIRSHHRDIGDFSDTAAILSQMDMVICVDTSVAHLAGALGVPTHILLSHTPDWRWGLTGETTVWYPSVKLVRQERFGDWGGALARIPAIVAT